MAWTEYLGQFLDYDPETNILQIQLSFITPEDQEKLEYGVLEKQDHKFKHRIKRTSSVSEQQRKCWYGSLRTIVIESELMPTAERLRKFDETMRKRCFPAHEIDLGDLDEGNEEDIFVPKSMTEMSHEEMGGVIQSLHDLYDFIDWSKYMGEY